MSLLGTLCCTLPLHSKSCLSLSCQGLYTKLFSILVMPPSLLLTQPW